jgi:uncharacterized protein (DUF305 family)
VLVLLASCSAGATAALLLTRTPGEDSAEAGFARDMMVHHAQAVQMAEIVRDKTQSDDAIRLLAADIALTQQAQIGMMQGWLQVWGLPPTSTKPAMSWMGHPTEGLMPGMATPQELDLLQQAPPEEADRLFLRLMIAHHQAAIPMAEAILERTDRPEVRQLAEAIEMSQKAEIQTMEGMLRNHLLGNSAKVELKPHNGSHASGTATFTEVGGGVRVELKLNDLPKPDTLYLTHIHQGTCAEGDTHEHRASHGGEEGYGHQHEGASHEHGAEIEYPLSQVKSDSEGHGSSTTTLRETSVEKLFSGDPKHVVNIHEAGTGNPPILTCADLKEEGPPTAE